jgi:hypothetical protein
MSVWMKAGCEECRNGVLPGMYTPEAAARQQKEVAPPTYVCSSIASHAHLYRCRKCGAWWEFNAREAHVIAESEAKMTFAEFFGSSKQVEQ